MLRKCSNYLNMESLDLINFIKVSKNMYFISKIQIDFNKDFQEQNLKILVNIQAKIDQQELQDKRNYVKIEVNFCFIR